MIKNKTIKYIAALLMLVMLTGAVLSGCGESGTYATQKNFITIGCVCPLSGELADYAEGSLEAEEEAVQEINENGGIYIDTLQRKLKVRFVIADSKSTEKGAEEAAKKLIDEENVDVVICSSGTKTVDAVSRVCEKEQIPFFSVNAENEEWLSKGSHSYSFNCSYDNTTRMDALKDVFEEAGITSVGLLAVESDGAERFAKTFQSYCNDNGIQATVTDMVDPDSLDFSAAIQKLASDKVQAVICYMSFEEFSKAWMEERLQELAPQMCVQISEDQAADDISKITRGSDIKEFYTLACWDKSYPLESSLTDENGNDLGLWWDDKFLSPCSELLGYKHGCTEIAIDAIKLAMALDAESIVSAAGSLNVDTVLGLVDFDRTQSSVLPCSVLKWTFDPTTVSWSKELYSHSQIDNEIFDDD